MIDQTELEGLLGRELSQYKNELLRLFGRHGYIMHALDSANEPPASSVALDFVNVHQGFWDLSDKSERALVRSHDGSDTRGTEVSNPGYISLPGICG